MTLETTTITDRPNATLPLTGNERIVMDEVGQGARTVDAPVSAVAALANPAIEAAIDAHEAAADPHPGYLTPAEGNAAYETAGAAASAVAAHVAAADPHPGYLTPAEGNAAYEAAGAVAAHVAAADPHTQYAQTADDVGLGTDDSPTFAGLTITGTAPVNIPHIHGSIAGNFYIHVRNTSGAPLAAGTAVYVTGSVGDTDRLTVAACDPTDTAKMPAVAILETTLANNGDGDAIILGELRPFNTAAFSLNQPLYVGAGGVLTGSVPTSGIVQAVATVARVQANTGTLVVHIGSQWPGLVTSTTAGLLPEFGTPTGRVFTDGGWATPSAGTPGGSSGQLQFNNGGAFGGVSTSSIDGSGNMTFSGRWIQSVNGAASAPPMSLTGTWFTGGTTTTTKPHFLIEPAGTTSTAWSTAGTGLGVNAPSGFTGNLLDLQVNGANRVRINSNGHFTSTTQFNGNVYCASILTAATSLFFGTSFDLVLQRDAANALAQRNGTNAQLFRIYNTFTSATNFERLNISWTSNEALIDTEAGSDGGTLRGLKIGSAVTSLLGFYGATPVNQPAAVADATDAATVITQLNALLSRLRTIGIIAT